MLMDCSKVNIRKGSKGEDVKILQKYLKYYKYYKNEVDGDCGNVTVEAIKSFQKYNKLVVDGVFGKLSCQKSWINGEDMSSTHKELPLKTWKDMMARYDKYVAEKKTEPQISYIDKEYPYEYVTNKQYKNIKSRYDAWVKEKGKEPDIVYINKPTTSTSSSGSSVNGSVNSNQTVFTVNHYCEKSGGNCAGQITAYHCGPHAVKQALRKFGITKYSESTIGSYAGTTSNGTGHSGLETAIWKIGKLEGLTFKIEWFNFSDLGSNRDERFKKYGQLMTDPKKAVFHHELYRNQYGHYSLIKTVNRNNSNLTIQNSLGNRCSYPAYCGYNESRGMGTQVSYFGGISQRSVCVITKV